MVNALGLKQSGSLLIDEAHCPSLGGIASFFPP